MINKLIERYPKLAVSKADIEKALRLIIECFENKKRLYVCGNGGSSSDADHIVGELMKGFKKKRPLGEEEIAKFAGSDKNIARGLMKGLPAVSLHSQSGFMTAFMNDAEPNLVYAQTLYSLGQKDDLLIVISTSGNSRNIVSCAKTAKAMGIKVVALTGKNKCALDDISDVIIHVCENETYLVQELHLPVYHYLCAATEEYFFEL